LQRALKLADACTSANPANAYLFLDLLETYIFFFESGNPSISPAYITGLVALVKEHTFGAQGDSRSAADLRSRFSEILQFIKAKKGHVSTAERFASVNIDGTSA
jgi:vacuolar protein sorting-associated protein 35